MICSMSSVDGVMWVRENWFFLLCVRAFPVETLKLTMLSRSRAKTCSWIWMRAPSSLLIRKIWLFWTHNRSTRFAFGALDVTMEGKKKKLGNQFGKRVYRWLMAVVSCCIYNPASVHVIGRHCQNFSWSIGKVFVGPENFHNKTFFNFFRMLSESGE